MQRATMAFLAADFIRAVGHVDEGPVQEKPVEEGSQSKLSQPTLASFIPVKPSIPRLDLKHAQSGVSFQAHDDDDFPVQREK